MNSSHQDTILQILTTIMMVNAQGKLVGFFDYAGHVQRIDVRFYEIGAFDVPDSIKKALHRRHVWLKRELSVQDSADDGGDMGEPNVTSLIGLLEFVQNLLQPTDQLEGEQAA
ncbi:MULTISPECIES: hypothetical protein [Pseudomonas]|uniref:hypothetical protein n=1 Tax=Pseudomonas TaxID=286 RepID=UPI00035829B6|nr:MULTISPECIES: hypothetical protein [Pseudomonas]EPM43293.1 hypothetical protein A262_28097 [Pseudomonas syringae pv. actinidiae ICMP 19073]KTB75342.1 hypothetical protein AO068_01190 [Pseudomonas sp. ICMP 3272]KTC55235.1 hypothetical protein AO258_01195 [Pseudomonas syringae ICMP 19498]